MKKTTKIGLLCLQFFKTKSTHVRVDIYTNMLTYILICLKKSAQTAKNKEIKKCQKLKYGPILHLKRIQAFQALSCLKFCGIIFRLVHIHSALIKTYFYKKPNCNRKNLGQMDENITKNSRLHAPIFQKLFSKSKSHSLNAAHEQQNSLAQKKLVHTATLPTFTISSKRRLNK